MCSFGVYFVWFGVGILAVEEIILKCSFCHLRKVDIVLLNSSSLIIFEISGHISLTACRWWGNRRRKVQTTTKL